MASTSATKALRRVIDGKPCLFRVHTWNPTVANLTLMALGSSAPEILFSVIELFSGQMYSGELGPSTIVGSAVFNILFVSDYSRCENTTVGGCPGDAFPPELIGNSGKS